MQSLLATISIGWPEILVGGTITAAVALLASFWPAARGHRSAPVLVVPGLLGGLPLLLVALGPHTDLAMKLVGSIPTLLAIGSLGLWFRQRAKRKREQGKGPGVGRKD